MMQRQLILKITAIAVLALGFGSSSTSSLAQFPGVSGPVEPILIPGMSQTSQGSVDELTNQIPRDQTSQGSVDEVWNHAPKSLVDEVWQTVNREYLDSTFNAQFWAVVRQQYLKRSYQSPEEAYQAIQTMLESLEDPLTRFMNPAEFKSLQVGDQDSMGIGLNITQNLKTREVVVATPIENTPAAQAGILPNDVLVKVNGQSTNSLDAIKVVQLLQGPVGTSVEVVVRRGRREHTFNMTRVPVENDALRYHSSTTPAGKIGYIRLTEFRADAPKQMRDAIQALEQEQVTGYILDLRSNPGGLLYPSIEIARMWLSGGTIATVVNRHGEPDRLQANRSSLTPKPLVVLVNKGTASGSEILAAALQENHRAQLVGSSTAGNNLIQSVKGLQDGSGLAVTIAKWLTPQSHDLHKSGLKPDVTVELTEREQEEFNQNWQAIATDADPQYAKALEVLSQQIAKAKL